jgi:iron complex outermembrane receptor protein
VKQFTQELDLDGHFFDDRLNWIVGAYYFHLTGDNTTDVSALGPLNPASPSTSQAVSQTTSSAGFTQANYRLTDALHVIAGVRYTRDKIAQSQNSSQDAQGCTIPLQALVGGPQGPCLEKPLSASFPKTNYTVGLDYRVSPDIMVYGKVSTGFKAGGFTAVITSTTVTAVPFLPENLTQYETGLKSEWFNHTLRANIAAYYSKYDEIQEPIIEATPLGITAVTANASKAHISGGELELVSVPTRDLRLAATAGYVRARYDQFVSDMGDVTNTPFLYTPEWTYSVSAAYTMRMPSGDLFAQLDWYWTDKQTNFPVAIDNKQFVPAIGLLNGRISKHLQRVGLDIAVYSRNLLNKKYFNQLNDLSNAFGTTDGWLAPPRTIYLELSQKF